MRHLFLLLMLAAPIGAAAHPHADVQQQVLISIGRTEAVLTYLVVPSTEDGGHMFDHMDTDGDGTLVAVEQNAFVSMLLDQTDLVIDGKRVNLEHNSVEIPERSEMKLGTGLITVTASTPLVLGAEVEHRVSLDVRYDSFVDGWYLQPFYFSDITEGDSLPVLNRPEGSTIELLIPAQ
ncbi:hypothetical protein [Yoonia maritima]|uniref:hypothetical protein n=1 Tax=Yoonia maritima TaxID=1435347 RepID=UPI000D0ECAD6|nr:hypothetical protein [Yoonia maritima]